MSTENKEMDYIDDETEEILDDLIDQVEEQAMEDEEPEEISFNLTDFNKMLEHEESRPEPDKKVIEFTIKGDPTTYKGKAMRSLGADAVIFLLMQPEEKLKKVKINQIETFS